MPLPLTHAANFWSEAFPVVAAFEERIQQTGIGAAQLALLAFLITFLIVRVITHLIHAGKGPFHDVALGGKHIHHLVWGILLLLVSGMLGISAGANPSTAWGWVVPITFGIGAALTLDEYALWVTLSDVYWEKEGRRSVDAVIVAGTMLAFIALGIPFWADVIANANVAGSWILGLYHGTAFVLASICFLKGKWIFAPLALLFVPIAVVGALRLGRPGSKWARRFYGVRKMTAARARYPHDGRMPLWPWQKPPVVTETSPDDGGAESA